MFYSDITFDTNSLLHDNIFQNYLHDIKKKCYINEIEINYKEIQFISEGSVWPRIYFIYSPISMRKEFQDSNIQFSIDDEWYEYLFYGA